MNYSLSDIILICLEASTEKNPVAYVSSADIRRYLTLYFGEKNWNEIDYISALHFLIGKGFIEQDAEHYRISADGKEYLYRLQNPEPDYQAKSYRSQQASNLLAIISIIIAVIGTFWGISTARFRGTSQSHAYTEKQTIPLSMAVADENLPAVSTKLSNWFDKLPQEINLLGIPYDLSPASPVIETESQFSSNPNLIYIPVNLQNVNRIHLLINLSYGAAKFTNGQPIDGLDICRVWLFSAQDKFFYELKAGKDIREWVIGSSGVVNSIDNHVIPIWTAHYRSSSIDAVIDRLVLEIPDSWRESKIDFIAIEDRSKELLNNVNPGIMIFGVTVEYNK